MDEPKEDEAGEFEVTRYNHGVIYIFGTVILLVIMALVFGLSAQNTKRRNDRERQKLAEAQKEPWYKSKPDTINQEKPVREVVPAATLIEKKPEDSLKHKQKEEEFRAMRAGLALTGGRTPTALGRKPTDENEQRLGRGRLRQDYDSEDKEDNADTNEDFLERARADDDADYLFERVKEPVSPFELKAGTIIPSALITGINSELPGQILGQVRENVYDTVSGEYLLLPQGTRLIGVYRSEVSRGQTRVLVAWKRLIFPNGHSLKIRGMPGTDEEGYSGFSDQVNNHYLRLFGSAIMLSVISGGAQLSQPESGHHDGVSAQETLAAALGQNLSQVSTELIRREMNVPPTLEVRPGYLFNVMVTQDIVFPGEYEESSQGVTEHGEKEGE